MSLNLRPLRMRGFVFNDIRKTGESRNLPNWIQLSEGDLKNWLLGMGNNVSASVDSVIDLGVWRHTEVLNPSTWVYNCYDITRDHELIMTEANMDEFQTWILRHNFAIVKTQPAVYLEKTGYHNDSNVFGSGVVYGNDGVVFIEREIPPDQSSKMAYNLYLDEEKSLLSVPEIELLTSRIPNDYFSSLVCKLSTSVSEYNIVTKTDSSGMLGQPLSPDDTAKVLELGRPKTLNWFSVTHTTRNGEHGLSWELMYESEDEAKKDLPNLKRAIKECKDSTRDKRLWWSEALHLNPPTITTEGNFIKLWATFKIPADVKQKIESNNLTPDEKKSLWFDVPALYDVLTKLHGRDYGILWQGF